MGAPSTRPLFLLGVGGWLALASAFATPSQPVNPAGSPIHRRAPTSTSRWAAAAAPAAAGGKGAAAAAAAAEGTCAQGGLRAQDEEVWALIEAERERQVTGIELIASENFVSAPVLEALGSVMTNKYSEGRPGARYYGGNEHVDKLERLCEVRT